MRVPRNQVFLGRRSYRLRRLGDAARLLPVLGLILFLLPLFWSPETAGRPRLTAWDGVYLFAIWLGLIVLSAIVSRKLARIAPQPDPKDDPDRKEQWDTPLFDVPRTGE
ncbi:MAG: hypothetical protein RLZZ437_1298 [Pseudomonadota bacterium]|jgi:hypothetical protein